MAPDRALEGCGAGLRSKHYSRVLSEKPPIGWFEAISENYMDTQGRPLAVLEEVRRHYPVALHGVALSIGSADPLDEIYLSKLKTLILRIRPAIVSDHLCWSGFARQSLHDLLPLPFTEEALSYVAGRVSRVQEFLGRVILLENVSSYVTFKHSTMPEWQFLSEVSRRTGCGILLDLNNVYVNAVNHRFNALEYLRGIPAEAVGQFHLAGHTDKGEFLFDTHSSEVIEPVWELYRQALALYGQTPTLIEWDENIPELEVLVQEVKKADSIYQNAAPRRISFSRDAVRVAETQPPPLLVDAQRRMKSWIRPGETPAEDGFLNPQGSASGVERMAVYADAYRARIEEALTETYEAVRHLMGSEAFSEAALEYAQTHPSSNYNLTNAGLRFPDFLAHSAWTAKLPFLPDLARLELAVMSAFHSSDAKAGPPDLTQLTEESADRAVVCFQPSVSVIRSVWPILDLWRARRTPVKNLDIEVEGRPQNVLVSRRGLEVVCELLDDSEAEAVLTLMGGKTLGKACQEWAEADEDSAPPVGDWFAGWSAKGLIADVRY